MRILCILTLILNLAFLCIQCSVEKRVYTKGLNIQWKSKKRNVVFNESEYLFNSNHSVKFDTLESQTSSRIKDSSLRILNNDNSFVKINEIKKHMSKGNSVNISESYHIVNSLKELDFNPFELNRYKPKYFLLKKESKNMADNTSSWLIFLAISAAVFLLGIFILLGLIFELFSIVSWFWLFVGVALTLIAGIALLIGLIGTLVNAVNNQEKEIKSREPNEDEEFSENREIESDNKVENKEDSMDVVEQTKEIQKKNGVYIFLGCIGALILAYFLL